MNREEQAEVVTIASGEIFGILRPLQGLSKEKNLAMITLCATVCMVCQSAAENKGRTSREVLAWFVGELFAQLDRAETQS